MKNKKKKQSSAQKIISEYAEKIIFYMKENKFLKEQLNDLRISLSINKEMLNNQIKHISIQSASNSQISEIIKSLQNENIQITNRNMKLYNDNLNLEKQLYKSQQNLNEKIENYEEKIKDLNNQIFVLSNQLMEKDNQIINYKNEIIKLFKDDYNTIVYICPTLNKFNIEMNNELVQTRSLIKKYSHFYHQEKLVSHNLKERVKELEDNIKKLNNGILLKKQETNINLIDCLFSDDDDDYYLDDDDYDNKKDDDDIQFPDKFNNLVKTSENITKVPKLDLSQVLSKYKKLENVKVVENKNKISHRSGDGEIIEKLNAQIRIFKQTIQRYKDRIKNLREQLSILRNRNKILESTLKNNYQNKFNNNNINNDISMNVNVSQIGDNFNFQNDINNIESETKLENIEINDEKKEN